MTFTLLLDLDDTLLNIETDEFIKSYFRALATHMAEHGIGDGFGDVLRHATREMMLNTRPDVTLREAFYADFFPKLAPILPAHLQPAPGTDADEQPVSQIIFRFYEQVFPTLRGATGQRPQAIALVKEALQRGYRVVVATNPLFPRTATWQRLEWAGLPADRYPFEIVSTYEDFHFTKPNPAYYAEILARMGFPEGPVVMVGNELLDDVQGAHGLGMRAFWVKPDGKEVIRIGTGDAGIKPDASGDLEDVLAWIDSQSEGDLVPDFRSFSASEALLRAVPAALATLVNALPPEFFPDHPQKDEWSALEVICHLRDVEMDIFTPRLERTLREERPELPLIDAAPWVAERSYNRQDARTALAEFTAARLRTLQFVHEAQGAGWQRTARHPQFGELSFAELVQRIVRHDQAHVRQIHSLLSAFLLEAR